ncbi:epsin, partial [Nannochloropsis gaditana CCMP526]
MEKRMHEALSNKNWGASSTLMNQIASDTYDYEKYHQVLKAIWSALDLPGRSWRSIFKALTLLDHLVKNGAERVVEE